MLKGLLFFISNGDTSLSDPLLRVRPDIGIAVGAHHSILHQTNKSNKMDLLAIYSDDESVDEPSIVINTPTVVELPTPVVELPAPVVDRATRLQEQREK